MADPPFIDQPLPPANLPLTAVPAVPGVRLNIAILLLWTACTAFVLSAFQPRLTHALANNAVDRVAHVDGGHNQAMPRRGPGARMIAMQTAVVTLATLCGAAIASLPLGMWKCTSRGPRFPTLPGHWLLICSGGVTLAIVVLLWLDGIEPARNAQFHLNGPLALLWVAVLMLCPALLLAAIVNVTGPIAWRAVFYLPFLAVFAVATLSTVSELLEPLTFAGAFMWLVLLLSVTANDFQSTTKFDWLHWTGIVIVLSQIVLFIGMTLLGLNPWD